MWHGSGTQSHISPFDDLRLPDAPGGSTESPWELSDLRHGVGASYQRSRTAGGFRAARHVTPILGRRVFNGSCRASGYGSAPASVQYDSDSNLGVDSVPALNPGGPVGGMAIFCARRPIRHQQTFEHVYADCAGNGNGVPLQRIRLVRSGGSSTFVSA